MSIQRLGRVLSCAPLALALLVLTPAQAPADMLMFTHTGSGSGSLDGEPFPLSDFIITAYVDTDDRQGFSSGWFIDHLSASISIEGVADVDFLTATRHFVNNSGQLVGFSRAGSSGADLFNGPSHPDFGTWDMLGPIGPISGTGYLLQWTNYDVHTTGGILVFADGSSDAVFTAVPEPATLGMLVVGGLALMLRRR